MGAEAELATPLINQEIKRGTLCRSMSPNFYVPNINLLHIIREWLKFRAHWLCQKLGKLREDDLQKLIYNYNIYQNQKGNHLEQRPLWCVFETTSTSNS
jgi:hypothetical protein